MKVPFPRVPDNAFPYTADWELLAVPYIVTHEKPLSKQDIQGNPLVYEHENMIYTPK